MPVKQTMGCVFAAFLHCFQAHSAEALAVSVQLTGRLPFGSGVAGLGQQFTAIEPSPLLRGRPSDLPFIMEEHSKWVRILLLAAEATNCMIVLCPSLNTASHAAQKVFTVQ